MKIVIAVAGIFAFVSCCTTPAAPDAIEILTERISHLETRVEHLETEIALLKVKPKDDAGAITIGPGYASFVGPPAPPRDSWTYYDGCNTCTCGTDGGCTCTLLSCPRKPL